MSTVPTLSKNTSSFNVAPGTRVNFTIEIRIDGPVTLVSLSDILPQLPSGSLYTIDSNTSGLFQ